MYDTHGSPSLLYSSSNLNNFEHADGWYDLTFAKDMLKNSTVDEIKTGFTVKIQWAVHFLCFLSHCDGFKWLKIESYVNLNVW